MSSLRSDVGFDLCPVRGFGLGRSRDWRPGQTCCGLAEMSVSASAAYTPVDRFTHGSYVRDAVDGYAGVDVHDSGHGKILVARNDARAGVRAF
jgi:hypothetical protein